jgi:hypothetical protein
VSISDIGTCARTDTTSPPAHADDAPAAAALTSPMTSPAARRRRDLDVHDRLEQARPRLHEALLQPHRRGDLKRHVGRVDVVV